MIEVDYKLYSGEEKTIEKVVLDENLHYLHMVLPENEVLPVHNTNSTVYMTVIKGSLLIGLSDQEAHVYEAGTLLKIPFNTRMDAKNLGKDTLELIVVKAPAPKT